MIVSGLATERCDFGFCYGAGVDIIGRKNIEHHNHTRTNISASAMLFLYGIASFVCVLSPASSISTSAQMTAKPCHYHTNESNWCYYVSTDQLSWGKAFNACADDGGGLITIQTESMQKFLEGLVAPSKSEFWIGASEYHTNWTWVDKTSADMVSSWYTGYPNNPADRYLANCGMMNLGFYKDDWRTLKNEECANDLPHAVCQISATNEAQCANVGNLTKFYGSVCYVVLETGATWYKAKSECQRLGGGLANLHDNATLMSVVERLMSDNEISDAVYSPGRVGTKDTVVEFWIGLFKNEWRWTTNDPVTYADKLRPTLANASCLFFSTEKGWSNQPCDSLRRYICQKYVGPPLTTDYLTSSSSVISSETIPGMHTNGKITPETVPITNGGVLNETTQHTLVSTPGISPTYLQRTITEGKTSTNNSPVYTTQTGSTLSSNLGLTSNYFTTVVSLNITKIGPSDRPSTDINTALDHTSRLNTSPSALGINRTVTETPGKDYSAGSTTGPAITDGASDTTLHVQGTSHITGDSSTPKTSKSVSEVDLTTVPARQTHAPGITKQRAGTVTNSPNLITGLTVAAGETSASMTQGSSAAIRTFVPSKSVTNVPVYLTQTKGITKLTTYTGVSDAVPAKSNGTAKSPTTTNRVLTSIAENLSTPYLNSSVTQSQITLTGAVVSSKSGSNLDLSTILTRLTRISSVAQQTTLDEISRITPFNVKRTTATNNINNATTATTFTAVTDKHETETTVTKVSDTVTSVTDNPETLTRVTDHLETVTTEAKITDNTEASTKVTDKLEPSTTFTGNLETATTQTTVTDNLQTDKTDTDKPATFMTHTSVTDNSGTTATPRRVTNKFEAETTVTIVTDITDPITTVTDKLEAVTMHTTLTDKLETLSTLTTIIDKLRTNKTDTDKPATITTLTTVTDNPETADFSNTAPNLKPNASGIERTISSSNFPGTSKSVSNVGSSAFPAQFTQTPSLTSKTNSPKLSTEISSGILIGTSVKAINAGSVTAGATTDRSVVTSNEVEHKTVSSRRVTDLGSATASSQLPKVSVMKTKGPRTSTDTASVCLRISVSDPRFDSVTFPTTRKQVRDHSSRKTPNSAVTRNPLAALGTAASTRTTASQTETDKPSTATATGVTTEVLIGIALGVVALVLILAAAVATFALQKRRKEMEAGMTDKSQLRHTPTSDSGSMRSITTPWNTVAVLELERGTIRGGPKLETLERNRLAVDDGKEWNWSLRGTSSLDGLPEMSPFDSLKNGMTRGLSAPTVRFEEG